MSCGGTAHGVCVWFDTVLAEGICFSNALWAPPLTDGGAFFPWADPVPLAVGDTVTVGLRGDLVGDGYVWGWDTRVRTRDDPRRLKADYRQSTFLGVPIAPAQLVKRAERYVPVLGEDGQVDRQVLALMDGSTPWVR
jgi:hypothetical protein